jgi:hypothetical protein
MRTCDELGNDYDLDFPNLAMARAFLLYLVAAFLIAGLACCAPRSPGDFLSQSQSCGSNHRDPSWSVLPSPADLASNRRSEPACSENLFLIPLARQFASNAAKNQSASAAPATQPKPASPDEHRFWDRENDLLFTAVAASRTLDYFSTLNFRRRGRNEILLTNDIVDNHAAFASIEAAGTAVSIGVSYLFHHYHHHRLERWTSIIHASLATSGAVRNYCLKTAHP